ncbi:MAG: hypothetical protein J2O46_00095 [Nocardioides sp.]|nr:hypothetical protein [Nocardioides sp.]
MPTLPKIDTAKIIDTKHLYAGAGVAATAYETVKSYATDAQKRIDGYRADATTRFSTAKTKVTSFDPKTAPAKAKALPEQLRTAAKTRLESTSATATGRYNDLATRGEAFVAKFKKADATEAPAEETPEA